MKFHNSCLFTEGLLQLNTSSNMSLHSYSQGAAYEYSCEEEGFVIDIPGYPEELIVKCIEPSGYLDDWYYEIWKDGIWDQKVMLLPYPRI